MDILDDVGVSKLSAKVFFFKVNKSFKYNYANVSLYKLRKYVENNM